MAKFQPHQLTPSERNKLTGELYSMVISLKNKEEVINFFKDLLTLSEAVMLARRIQVAKLLLQGYNYEEIQQTLKIGMGTILRVEHWLYKGFNGYSKAIERVSKQQKRKGKTDQFVDPHSLRGVARRYPLPFLLINALYEISDKHYERQQRKKKK